MRFNAIDLVLETPGGSGEAAEDVVRLVRRRFKSMGVIVPGTAKSAGTILAMAGDEIPMSYESALDQRVAHTRPQSPNLHAPSSQAR